MVFNKPSVEYVKIDENEVIVTSQTGGGNYCVGDVPSAHGEDCEDSAPLIQ